MRHTATFLAAFVLFLSSTLYAEPLKLAGLFSDHMVIQRDRPVPVWGQADPGEQVTVEFAGQKKTAEADATGRWRVNLDPLPASAEGRKLVVQSSVESRNAVVADVLVGDVWLCSGQSNMAFQMKRTANAKQDIGAADHPLIRFFVVEQKFAQQPLADVGGSWKVSSPDSIETCSAVAYYFAVSLREKYDVPIGLLVSSVGGTRIETWTQHQTLVTLGKTENLIEKWKNVPPAEFENIVAAYRVYQNELYQVHPQAVRDAKAAGKPAPPEPTRPAMRPHDCPSALHNGMIAPLKPFAIRGAIWYQGESNAGQGLMYEKLQPALITDWRKTWGEQLPFLFVQLAPHKSIHPQFRESQLRIWQNTPNTGMAVTLDVGDENDIHPTLKRPVGKRLALAARAIAFGESINYSGPVFQSLTIKDNQAVVSYTHVGQGLKFEGGTLKGFTIAGNDGKFVPAKAVIEGSTVVVSSDEVKQPVSVRYGWAFVPDCNLYNLEGLPAAPFRSDAPADAK
jgi:sialate O-acetylesterase